MTLERAVDILNVNVICSPKATEFKEAVDVVKLALRQSVEFIPNSKDIEDIQRDAVINFAERYKEKITDRYEDIAYKDLFFGVIDELVRVMFPKGSDTE